MVKMTVQNIICDVKGTKIGHNNPIVIQTMCNTHTADIEASVTQCRELSRAGSGMIRLTTQGIREVEALKEIKKRLSDEGIETPLVADVHFSADVALAAAMVADKVRINPGNFSKDPLLAISKFEQLTDICASQGTAIRIGLNHGSLGKRITELYGDTPEGMAEAAMEWLRLCVKNHFFNVTVSLKSSNTAVMVNAYKILYRKMAEELNMLFPLHLGVTEAGNGISGRVKSAVGIGALLSQGIGDTIRVSLTEPPVNELPAAAILAEMGNKVRNTSKSPDLEIDETNYSDPFFNIVATNEEEFIIKAAYYAGPELLDHKIDDFSLSGIIVPAGTEAENGKKVPGQFITEIKDEILQASRRKFTKPEYIACPSCGRTMYDIETVLNEVKKRTSHLAGIKIAVMGCIVNGPGEMADADYGYVGEGAGKVTLYKGKMPVMTGIPQSEAIERLLALIESDTTYNG